MEHDNVEAVDRLGSWSGRAIEVAGTRAAGTASQSAAPEGVAVRPDLDAAAQEPPHDRKISK